MTHDDTNAQPVDDGPGTPPEHLNPELRALWAELAADVPANACTPADRHAFGLLVALVQRVRDGNFTGAEAQRAAALLDSFAMTPAGKQRLRWAQLEPRDTRRQ